MNKLVIICEVFGMHHQLGGSTEDDMNKMSVIGHISLYLFIYLFKIFLGDGQNITYKAVVTSAHTTGAACECSR